MSFFPPCLSLHSVDQSFCSSCICLLRQHVVFSIVRELCWLAVRAHCHRTWVSCDTLLIAHDYGDLRNACTSSHVSVYAAVSPSRCRVDSLLVTIDGR